MAGGLNKWVKYAHCYLLVYVWTGWEAGVTDNSNNIVYHAT